MTVLFGFLDKQADTVDLFMTGSTFPELNPAWFSLRILLMDGSILLTIIMFRTLFLSWYQAHHRLAQFVQSGTFEKKKFNFSKKMFGKKLGKKLFTFFSEIKLKRLE